MKYMEFIDSTFFAFTAKSDLLCELLGNYYLFGRDENELNFGWGVKGDSFIGEEEEIIAYGSYLPYETPDDDEEFDFCGYLISLLNKHSNCGFIDGYSWREGLRMYDADENVNYGELPLYEEKLDSNDIQEIISILKANYDKINQSVEKFGIFEYNFLGEYGESKLELLTFNDGCYSKETLDEDEVNDLMVSDSFNDDVLSDDSDIELLLETLLEKYL